MNHHTAHLGTLVSSLSESPGRRASTVPHSEISWEFVESLQECPSVIEFFETIICSASPESCIHQVVRWHKKICFAYAMMSSKIRIRSNINLRSVKHLFSHSLSCYKVLWIAIRWLHNNIIMSDECPTVPNKHICHCKINELLALFLHIKTFRIGMSLRTVQGTMIKQPLSQLLQEQMSTKFITHFFLNLTIFFPASKPQ